MSHLSPLRKHHTTAPWYHPPETEVDTMKGTAEGRRLVPDDTALNFWTDPEI